jgi:hypothetical protein
MARLNGFKPDWAERIYRGRTKAFGKGYVQGVFDERDRIVRFLMADAVISTNLDVHLLQRVVEIVEGETPKRK